MGKSLLKSLFVLGGYKIKLGKNISGMKFFIEGWFKRYEFCFEIISVEGMGLVLGFVRVSKR